ncbi:MAG: type I DNA topoisomerase [Clostridia bacterium]|nr:type I DNA topoisomerase [Clostridia bacterium]
MANLVIVESPSKASTIKGYLGSNYKVIASKGHVRDLPKSTLGVDIENNFDAHYINIRGKGDLIKEIRKEAKAANKVFLATDPDREGEAISWHLAAALGIPVEKTMRVTFNEITKAAVKSAIKEPRQIDMNLVNAQQARRILDRIVGYKLSPLLWKNVRSGLSAGRVQSVATRMIVEREEEIRAFVPAEYWTIDASLKTAEGEKEFSVRFYGDEKKKIKLSCQADADRVVEAVRNAPFRVRSVKKSKKKKLPAPPFTTSTLQQEAARKLGFQSQRIMRIAQELYEGVNVGSENGGTQGLITYMRTDSLRVSADAQNEAKAYIAEKYGDAYAPNQPRVYKARAGAQDAHEAIRPTRVGIEPAAIRKYVTLDQYKLYKLIWERFVASQMESATLSTVTADFESAGYLFRTSGYTVDFQGYMAVYEESEEERSGSDEPREEKNLRLPNVKEGDPVLLCGMSPEKHFTEPPARYNDASLIKFLEEMGIGRPSTFATIITTILARNYVKREGKSLVPTPTGELTNRIMKESFPDIVNYRFTAQMEQDLDGIEEGSHTMESVLGVFWKGFEKELSAAEEKMKSEVREIPVEETDLLCDKCGSRMIVKNGRFGKFAACPNYPQCRNTKPLVTPAAEGEEAKPEKAAVVADFKCEQCGADMVQRVGRYGTFFACSRFPECKFTKQKTRELGVDCPKCGSAILIKTGKNRTLFYSCEKYPSCDFSSWDMPLKETCPQCGGMLFRKKGQPVMVCHNKECGFKKPMEEETRE